MYIIRFAPLEVHIVCQTIQQEYKSGGYSYFPHEF